MELAAEPGFGASAERSPSAGSGVHGGIDYRAARGLDKQVVRSLTNDSDWVRRHRHIFLVGPTGIGKTYLARAFGHKACRDGFTAYFATAAQLFRELELARADGSFAKKLRALGQVDALIVDDWAMAPFSRCGEAGVSGDL